MKIKYKKETHEVTLSKCGKYYVCSNGTTKFKVNKCEVL